MRRSRRCGRSIGTIEGAETKKSLGFHSARTMTPQAALESMGHEEGRPRSVAGVQAVPPQGPMTVDVSFKHYLPGGGARLSADVRADALPLVRFRAKDMVEASSVMEFIGEYQSDLTP